MVKVINVYSGEIAVRTRGKGTYKITAAIERLVRESSVSDGQVTIFRRHTSASLILMENADPLPAAIWNDGTTALFVRTTPTSSTLMIGRTICLATSAWHSPAPSK